MQFFLFRMLPHILVQGNELIVFECILGKGTVQPGPELGPVTVVALHQGIELDAFWLRIVEGAVLIDARDIDIVLGGLGQVFFARRFDASGQIPPDLQSVCFHRKREGQ